MSDLFASKTRSISPPLDNAASAMPLPARLSDQGQTLTGAILGWDGRKNIVHVLTACVIYMQY